MNLLINLFYYFLFYVNSFLLVILFIFLYLNFCFVESASDQAVGLKLKIFGGDTKKGTVCASPTIFASCEISITSHSSVQ